MQARRGLGVKRSVDVARRAHLGALISARPRIRDIIRDHCRLVIRVTFAGAPGRFGRSSLHRLPGHPWLAAQLYLQKAAHAADEAWQQTVQGHNGPTVTNPTIPVIEQSSLASQHDDDEDGITFAPARKLRLYAPQLQAQLSRLSDGTRLGRLKSTPEHCWTWLCAIGFTFIDLQTLRCREKISLLVHELCVLHATGILVQ